jgi:hypothetical protein
VQVLPQLVRRCKGQMLLDPLLLCVQFEHKLVKPQRLLQCLAPLAGWFSQCTESVSEHRKTL